MCSYVNILEVILLQVKGLKSHTGRRQTLPVSRSQSCHRSSPCRFRGQEFSLPTCTVSGSMRARFVTCSIGWTRPTLRTNCWGGSSIATRWHCSTSKTQKTASLRLVGGFCPFGVSCAHCSHFNQWVTFLTSTAIYYLLFKTLSLALHSRRTIWFLFTSSQMFLHLMSV